MEQNVTKKRNVHLIHPYQRTLSMLLAMVCITLFVSFTAIISPPPLISIGVKFVYSIFFILCILIAIYLLIRILYFSRLSKRKRALLSFTFHEFSGEQKAIEVPVPFINPLFVENILLSVVYMPLFAIGIALYFVFQLVHSQLPIDENTYNTINALMVTTLYFSIIALSMIFLTYKEIQKNASIAFQKAITEKSFQNARFFCRYRIGGVFKKSILFYEVTTEQQTILWYSIPNKHVVQTSGIGSLFVDYHQNMQHLIESVSASTGLPLYDFSGPEPIQVYPPLEQTEGTLPQEQQESDERATDLEK